MDFKVRVLDFISIYTQQKATGVANAIDGNNTSLQLIQGLLTSIKVAHQDGHQTLCERAKSVLSTMAKQGLSEDKTLSAEAIKE